MSATQSVLLLYGAEVWVDVSSAPCKDAEMGSFASGHLLSDCLNRL